MNKKLTFIKLMIIIFVLFFSIPLFARRSGGRSGSRGFSSRRSSSSHSYSRSSSSSSGSSYSGTRRKGTGYYDPSNNHHYYNSDMQTKTDQDAEVFADIVVYGFFFLIAYIIFITIKNKLTKRVIFKITFSKKHEKILELNEKIKEEIKESVIDDYIPPKALKNIFNITLENEENINIENIEFINEDNYKKHKDDIKQENALFENIKQNNVGDDDLIIIMVTILKKYSPEYNENNKLELIKNIRSLAQESILPDNTDKIYTSFIVFAENVDKTALFG